MTLMLVLLSKWWIPPDIAQRCTGSLTNISPQPLAQTQPVAQSSGSSSCWAAKANCRHLQWRGSHSGSNSSTSLVKPGANTAQASDRTRLAACQVRVAWWRCCSMHAYAVSRLLLGPGLANLGEHLIRKQASEGIMQHQVYSCIEVTAGFCTLMWVHSAV